MKILNKYDLDQIDKAIYERSLVEFIQKAWSILEPTTPYVHNWHIDAIAEHLEAITKKQITRLLINVPPGMMKSLLVNVFWPSWEWALNPSLRFIGASHEQSLAVRDNLKMRRLIESDWYQYYWPVKLTSDQNEKLKFENNKTGFRQACPVTSMTGNRGDRVMWDDPHSIEGALSTKKREATLRVLKETLPSRINDPEESAIVIIMQRIHENDVSGHILSKESDYVHLCLPMEFDPERICTTKIGFKDPRTENGELLFEKRYPRKIVERDKAEMGEYAVAGQFQQRPAPRGGGMFPVEKFEIIENIDQNDIIRSVRYWDKAGTDSKEIKKSGDRAFTAGVKMHRLRSGKFLISHVKRGQWEAYKREMMIKQTAHNDSVNVPIWVEQEPGSGGKESAQNTIINLSGYSIRAERPQGDKIFRADPYAAQVQAGNFLLLKGSWNQDFIDEHEIFPNGKTKDQVDACSGAFSKLNFNMLDDNASFEIHGTLKTAQQEQFDDDKEVKYLTTPDF